MSELEINPSTRVEETITPEYVYLTIPAEYVCIYHKLLTYMADFGKKIIDDCQATCKGSGKNIITCWNLFQSAIACKTLGRDKEAEFFINYITKQLNTIYKNSDSTIYENSLPVAITTDGQLKAKVSCGNGTKFVVDTTTGLLYRLWLKETQDNTDYAISDDDLTADKTGDASGLEETE